MTIAEMVKRYRICLATEGRIGVYNASAAKRDGMVETIMGKKAEIIAYINAKQEAEARAKAEREAKIASIEGLSEIRNAIRAEREYHVAFEKMMENEYNDGAFAPKTPETDSNSLKARYPRAAAYLKAESWTRAANFAKVSAGNKAMERIINGDDYDAAIRDMEKEFGDYCTEHMWD